MKVDVEITGTREAVADLSGLAERAANPRPALLRVKDILAGGLAKQYSSGGSYFDSPWAPNRPGTLARKARLGQSTDVLTAGGDLGTALGGGRGKRHRVTRTTASVGVALWYAHLAEGPTKRAPRRQLVGVSDGDHARAVREVERYILTGRFA